MARDLEPRGLTIKVFDCYRPAARGGAFRALGAQPRRRRDARPSSIRDVDKRKLFRDGYIAARSGHSRGSTVDLTLARRADGSELDMGTPFDFFSPRSWPSDKSVSAEAQANRALLAQAMRRRGFRPYDKEWWHFTLRERAVPRHLFRFSGE